MNHEKSRILFERAQQAIPGGVNSPVRSFRAVGGIPRFIVKGQGARIYDADGNAYIDYMMSWGPLILGHAHPAVVKSVRKAALEGTSFGASTEREIELAEMVKVCFPAADKVRLVSSGTEAAMTALRLARAVTGRELIVKFDGGYHGHSDALLVKAGSGLATGGMPGSAGVPESVVKGMVSLPYNDITAVEKLFHQEGKKIAGIIVEPAAANMGVIPPAAGFLETLRKLTAEYGTILIFDEVITGFRVARGGACELFGVTPDLICLGKIIGGGLPIGAVAGNRDIMERLAPLGDVYQAGTLSGNPISTAAGLATLKEIGQPDFYIALARTTSKLAHSLKRLFDSAGIPVVVNHLPGLLTIFFGRGPVSNYDSVQRCNMDRFARFFAAMLEEGVYLPPSGFEAWFISSAHGDNEIENTLETVSRAINRL